MALTSGTRMGPYEVFELIGSGVQGEAYRARDTRLGRNVAIKVLPPHLSIRPELRERFEHGATHPMELIQFPEQDPELNSAIFMDFGGFKQANRKRGF